MAAIQEAARSTVMLLVNATAWVSIGRHQNCIVTDVEVFSAFLYLGCARLHSQCLLPSLVQIPGAQELCCNTDPFCQSPGER